MTKAPVKKASAKKASAKKASAKKASAKKSSAKKAAVRKPQATACGPRERSKAAAAPAPAVETHGFPADPNETFLFFIGTRHENWRPVLNGYEAGTFTGTGTNGMHRGARVDAERFRENVEKQTLVQQSIFRVTAAGKDVSAAEFAAWRDSHLRENPPPVESRRARRLLARHIKAVGQDYDWEDPDCRFDPETVAALSRKALRAESGSKRAVAEIERWLSTFGLGLQA